jgi:hypothetical protein
MVNLSMNQTLARSINTSLVAILPVLSVLVVGSPSCSGASSLQRLRPRPGHRPHQRCVLVHLHRLAAARHLEGAGAALRGDPPAPRVQAKVPARRGRSPLRPLPPWHGTAGGGNRSSGRARQSSGVIRPGAASEGKRAGSGAPSRGPEGRRGPATPGPPRPQRRRAQVRVAAASRGGIRLHPTRGQSTATESPQALQEREGQTPLRRASGASVPGSCATLGPSARATRRVDLKAPAVRTGPAVDRYRVGMALATPVPAEGAARAGDEYFVNSSLPSAEAALLVPVVLEAVHAPASPR